MSISLSTHVLNLDDGNPVAGMEIAIISARTEGVIAKSTTDADGRIGDWGADIVLNEGHYKLRFNTGDWFEKHNSSCFYPRVVIEFAATETRHYHVPLLVNRFGYSTYRGS